MNTTSMAIVKFSVEVITLPVSDVDRALRFYVDKVGFTLDVDYSPNNAFRIVQLTPPGSSCSIQIGRGLTDAPAGSLRNVYLVVIDLEAARSCLLERGVNVGEIRHKTPIGAWDVGFAPGLVPGAETTRASPTSRTPMATAGCYKNGATAGMLLRRGIKRRKVNGERCESSLVSVVYRPEATREGRRRQSSRLLLTIDSRHRH